MTDSILVIGATGVVGSELVRQLAASGRRVKALVRSEQKAASVADLATPVIGDLMAPDTLVAPFKGIERVFVLSPPIPTMEAMDNAAFDAALAAGVRRIVFLSNYGADEFGDDYHYVAHGNAERRLAALDVDWTVLRPARFMTNTPFVWSSVFQRDLVLERASDGAMVVVDPVDVAAIGLLALTTDGHERKTYTLTSEDSFSPQQLAELLSRRLGRKLGVFQGDEESLRAALVESGAPGDYAPLMARYFDAVDQGHWRVTDTVQTLLGRRPGSYEQWLDRNLSGLAATFGA